LSLLEHLRTYLELFGTTNSTIPEASLGYLDSQGVFNGDAVTPLRYVKLGYNDEIVARFGTLGGLAYRDV